MRFSAKGKAITARSNVYVEASRNVRLEHGCCVFKGRHPGAALRGRWRNSDRRARHLPAGQVSQVLGTGKSWAARKPVVCK